MGAAVAAPPREGHQAGARKAQQPWLCMAVVVMLSVSFSPHARISLLSSLLQQLPKEQWRHLWSKGLHVQGSLSSVVSRPLESHDPEAVVAHQPRKALWKQVEPELGSKNCTC
mmetsp:Transcript_32729/g.44494  ORF Transcript_32729/g.44494 Transcript_32729/m.44494 type:complete len:113 (+) Transcript_32729:405-743(+)